MKVGHLAGVPFLCPRGSPENLEEFSNQQICVHEVVTAYSGRAEVVIHEPSALSPLPQLFSPFLRRV